MVLIYEKRDKVATITINRPEVMNSINMEGLLRRIIGDTEDAHEGMRAFKENRKPEYRGR